MAGAAPWAELGSGGCSGMRSCSLGMSGFPLPQHPLLVSPGFRAGLGPQPHLLCLSYALMRHLQLVPAKENAGELQLRRPPTQPTALRVRERSWGVRRELGNEGWVSFRRCLSPVPSTPGCPLSPPASPSALPQPLSAALLCLCTYCRSSSFLFCILYLR